MDTASKMDKSIAFLTMFFFQASFYFIGFAMMYWMITFNIFWLTVMLIVIVLQSFVTKSSQTYSNFLTKTCKVHLFFPSSRKYEEAIPQNQCTLFTVHPHSVFTYGLHSNLHHPMYPNEKLSNMTPLASRFILYVPFIGLHFKLWGLSSVDPNNLKKMMKEKRTLSIVPGGFEEATLTTPKQMRFFIKQRKGFIKYALKFGYTIRPILILKQHQVLSTFDGLKELRLKVNKLKIPAVIFWSLHGLFYPPFKQLKTVVGKGIKGNREYQMGEDPTNEEINEVHKKYIENLHELYDKYRQENNGVPLKIY